ncbi:MAG TPA: hypothetical protein VGB62_07880 [Allosphingosinicella sp.]|jgi:hypothetical protein
MRASRLSPFGFALAAAAGALALLAPIAALNLTMDPYSVANGAWYRLRSPGYDPVGDIASDGGATARTRMVARSQVPVLLLGTSRVQQGFRTDPERIFNGGQSAASLEDLVRIMEAAADRPVPPRAYVMELAAIISVPAQRRATATADFPKIGPRLLATTTTHVSIHLLRHWAIGFSGERDDFFLPLPPPAQPVKVQRATDAQVRPSLLPETGAAGNLKRLMRRALALCARSGAQLILFEAPVHPDRLADPRVARNVAARTAAYGAELDALGPSYPRCRAMLVDYSGRDRAGAIPQTRDPMQWLDPLHFRPDVGAAMVRRVEPLIGR